MIFYCIAVLFGALSVTAYAPLEWWFLMPVCIAVIFQLLQKKTPKQAFWCAFLFGLGQFGVGASWVYVSLQTYGNMPVWMAGVAVFLFVASYASLTGVMGFVYAKFSQISSAFSYKNIVFFAALWVIAEWSRSILFTGFPWLDIGYSQTTQWLSGYAPLGSVYLVSFVCVLVSVLLLIVVRHIFYLLLGELQASSLEAGSLKKTLFSACLAFMLISIGAFLQTKQWSQASGKSYQVVIIQGNVDINQKWQQENQSAIINDYVDQIAAYSADLVILPETALPVSLHQTHHQLWQLLKGNNNAILSGIVEQDIVGGNFYNSANLVCGNEPVKPQPSNANFYQGEQIYRKQHLVPFGEYLPLRSVLNWLLEYLQIPMSDFSSGSGVQELKCDGLEIGLSICYEDAFASGMRRSLPKDSQNGILVNISEDAWFGDSLAPHQRVQMAQMRAIELARPMLRSANSGPSTHIGFRGEVLASTKQFQKDSLLVDVQPREGDTPFMRFGLWIVLFSFFFAVIVISLQIFRKDIKS